MEIRNIGDTVFVVVYKRCEGVITAISYAEAEIEGATVSKDYSVSYQTSKGWVDSSCVFDTKNEALFCIKQKMEEQFDKVVDSKILDDVRATSTHTYEPHVSIDEQVIALRHMDNIIRSINDEENGIFDGWITLHVPDRASDEELRDFCETDPMFYPDACEFFARHVANMIDEGSWSSNGWSTELWRNGNDNC